MKLGSASLRVALSAVTLLWALLLSNAPAIAELRVIVQYDAEGHSLLRAVELGESGSGSSALTGDAKGDPATHALLKWFSADGALIHSASIIDPRYVRAPMAGAGQAHEQVGLERGAYMVVGPTGSAVLEVSLPANPRLGLYSHIYRIDLL